MILAVCCYEIQSRKGLLFFHQRCETANSPQLVRSVFDNFETHYDRILKDRDATRIRSVDDMSEEEIQLLENAKIRALKSLPQSPLYWGSHLYHVHMNYESVFVKLPLWFEFQRFKGREVQNIELDKSWTKFKREDDESFGLSPRTPEACSKRLVSERDLKRRPTFRIASILSTPRLFLPPLFVLSTAMGDES